MSIHAAATRRASGVDGTIGDMADPLVSIGDFSRMSHLTVKALRFYHDVGILVPHSIDPDSGYRRYSTAQVPVAQVVRRLRLLNMPVDAVREVVAAPDVESRNAAIVRHLAHMEEQLARTQAAVGSLRTLLEPPDRSGREIRFRDTEDARALAISSVVRLPDALGWVGEAIAELLDTARRFGLTDVGVPGALFAEDVFERGSGEVVAFVTVGDAAAEATTRGGQSLGRAAWRDMPAGEWAVLSHAGSCDDLDATYGDLGTFVAARAIGVAGPIRENFVVSAVQTEDESLWVTEVAWPVFRTSA